MLNPLTPNNPRGRQWPMTGALLVCLFLSACSSLPKVPGLASGKDSAVAGPAEVATQTPARSLNAVPAPPVKAANRDAYRRALAAIEQQRWQDAEPLLRKITHDQPGIAAPWVNLSQVYMGAAQYEEARQALVQAVAADPNHCPALNQLGVLSRKVGEFEAAEQHYKQCLKTEPDNQTVVLNLGILYELYLGRLPEALAAYRQYQDLGGRDDRKVKGWVIDLERRLGV